MSDYKTKLYKGKPVTFKVVDIKAHHKAHGLRQFLMHDLNIKPSSPLHLLLKITLFLFIPKSYLAHMILGVGQKT